MRIVLPMRGFVVLILFSQAFCIIRQENNSNKKEHQMISGAMGYHLIWQASHRGSYINDKFMEWRYLPSDPPRSCQDGMASKHPTAKS